MTRPRTLPPAWYPTTAEGVTQRCSSWDATLARPSRRAAAVVVPHAGWAYSGRLAYMGLRELVSDADAVVVVGGHLRPHDPVLVAPESAYETPLGELQAENDLAAFLHERLEVNPDRSRDNTVEVQLPLVHHLFPNARCLSVRSPPSPVAQELGVAIAEYARATGLSVAVVGSTDLTHYGPAYGFEPAGQGEEAARWVRERNDAAFVSAVLRLDAAETVRRGLAEQAACSPGAAATAIGFARSLGVASGRLLEYGQSRDVRRDDSFVGYAAIAFEP